MQIFQVLVLIWCFVGAPCVTQEELEYVQGIRKLEEDASKWTRPTNASSYESHGIGNICTYMLPYDFVIIGGGTGGSVVANRLSEIFDWSVLLLEAGDEETKITKIPAEMYYLAASAYNWGYKTEPLQYFGGYEERRAVIRSGRVLGGKSAIDYLLYIRGNPEDFDNWANKTRPDWSYENVLHYFKKSESEGFYGSEMESHGHSGPMYVEHPHYDNDISRAYMQAQMQRGRQFLDYNSQKQCGFATPQVHQVKGVRQSSADAFLTPVQNRLNLKVLLNSFVLKINIDKITKKAESVKFVSNNKCYIVPVVKDVILSAGAIVSPQILMLSGVGITSHLESLNIPVIADLPVGNNLRSFLSMNYPVYSINFTYPQYNLETLVENYLNKKGFLTGPTAMQVMQFVNTENSSDTCVPNIEYIFIAGPGKNDSFEFYKNVFGYTNETYQSMVKPIQNMSTYSAYIIDLYPKTQGTIRLKSNVPYDYPKITIPYFEDSDDDVETLLQGIRDFQDTANTTAMKQYNATMVKLVHPLCQNYTWDSDSFWKCMIMNLAQILHHYTGTCKMGRAGDPTAVVDPDLKVFHIENLRVVDSSVIPESTSGNTRTVTTMVAEKAADIIKEGYGRLSN